ncbi:MAG: DNA-3-methyladenine glycosylase 2 family protein [Oscillospiraceae bacterium]|jgi:N-glycosylase/DNA lyase|nr:DNA-3-methyladenine glycosylase 2 family protein [Oscillospiraceae bacterium]
MDYSGAFCDGGDYILTGLKNFSLRETLECGQCFRWERLADNTYEGIVCGLRRRLSQQGDSLRIHGGGEAEFLSLWRGYFDLGRDYGALKELFSPFEPLRRAVEYSPGLRVLRQEPFETLCTFILSQNNNIPRIGGLVKRLCELLGEQLAGGGYAFPQPQAFAGKTAEDLSPVRSGFRAGYLVDAAQKTLSGELPLRELSLLPLEESLRLLKTVRGVGPKVAACTLLYGCGRAECVPVDVWIGRALEAWFPGGLPEEIAPVAGIAQQYLFHYARMSL